MKHPEYPVQPARNTVYPAGNVAVPEAVKTPKRSRLAAQIDKGLKLFTGTPAKEEVTVGACMAKIELLTREHELSRKLNEEISAKLIATQKQLELIRLERDTIQNLLSLEQQSRSNK